MKKKDVLIIIPAYNEGNNIRRTLNQLENLEMKENADILAL